MGPSELMRKWPPFIYFLEKIAISEWTLIKVVGIGCGVKKEMM
jgi:hypothetical protein